MGRVSLRAGHLYSAAYHESEAVFTVIESVHLTKRNNADTDWIAAPSLDLLLLPHTRCELDSE